MLMERFFLSCIETIPYRMSTWYMFILERCIRKSQSFSLECIFLKNFGFRVIGKNNSTEPLNVFPTKLEIVVEDLGRSLIHNIWREQQVNYHLDFRLQILKISQIQRMRRSMKTPKHFLCWLGCMFRVITVKRLIVISEPPGRGNHIWSRDILEWMYHAIGRHKGPWTMYVWTQSA